MYSSMEDCAPTQCVKYAARIGVCRVKAAKISGKEEIFENIFNKIKMNFIFLKFLLCFIDIPQMNFL